MKLPVKDLNPQWRIRTVVIIGILIAVIALVPAFALQSNGTRGFKITSPNDGSVNQGNRVAVTWTSLSRASSYRLEVTDRNNNRYQSGNYSFPTDQTTLVLTMQSSKYVARVKAFDSNGERIARTSSIQFNINSNTSSSTSTTRVTTTSTTRATTTSTTKATTTSTTKVTTTTQAPTTSTSPLQDGQIRTYPLHTSINATTYWVGELFQNTPDGSQVCSAYDSDWIYSFFQISHAKNCKTSTSGYVSGCDAVLKVATGKCDDTNSIGSLRTPENGYFPAGLQPIYQNPFYIDLPYDDFNPTDSTDITGYSTRCQDIPWANDPGYKGNCTNRNFSYMKNRWVQVIANNRTCYGQIEDAGPADDGNGNPHYDDRNYVFGSNDARPINKSYNSAGMDISPALNACLGGKFNQDLKVSWRFVDSPPSGPWTKIITTSGPQ